MIDNSSSGSRLHSALSSKEGTPAEALQTKNITHVGSSHSGSGPTPHSRNEQRTRFEKSSGGRKLNEAKANEEPINGTTA